MVRRIFYVVVHLGLAAQATAVQIVFNLCSYYFLDDMVFGWHTPQKHLKSKAKSRTPRFLKLRSSHVILFTSSAPVSARAFSLAWGATALIRSNPFIRFRVRCQAVTPRSRSNLP